MLKDYWLYFKWKEDGKLEVAYEENDNESLFEYFFYVSVPLRILISGDFSFFFYNSCWQKNMSRKWCHWFMLSPAEWKNCDHEKVICGQYNQ